MIKCYIGTSQINFFQPSFVIFCAAERRESERNKQGASNIVNDDRDDGKINERLLRVGFLHFCLIYDLERNSCVLFNGQNQI
jgi:hypothetical protein